jgi:hypothetical protein
VIVLWLSCLVLSCIVLSRLVLSCIGSSHFVLSCLGLSCLVLSWPVLSCLVTVFSCGFLVACLCFYVVLPSLYRVSNRIVSCRVVSSLCCGRAVSCRVVLCLFLSVERLCLVLSYLVFIPIVV